MSRSTRSSAKKVHGEMDEVDGFSVVDSDKTQKGKEAKPKNEVPAKKEEKPQEVKEEEKEKPAPMDVDGEETGSGDQPVAKDGENESVAEAPCKENGTGEAGEEKPKEGEDVKTGEAAEESKTGEETAEKTGEENGENKEKPEQTEETKDKKPKHPIVWVSNISRHVKATDLKKHFSKHGKVVTAKVVTNGKSFFGYVCLDTLEAVEVCVKNLNNSDFEGRKINVTVDKPLRDDKILRKRGDDGSTPVTKDPLTIVFDSAADKKSGEHKDKDKDKGRKDDKRKVDTSKMTVEELRKEVALCEREIDRLRTRLIEEQSRSRADVKRCRRLERELGDAEIKIREDRKRYDRDREEWGKKNRLEHLRIDADRVILEREKSELRRAREDFERDLRHFIEDQQRAAMDRSRGQSPHAPAKRFRPDDGPGDSKSAWLSEAVVVPPRDGSAPGRNSSQFFNSWNASQGNGSSQWRNMGPSPGGQPPYFRGSGGGDSYRPSGGSFGGPVDGGFRGNPYEAAPRKF